MSTSRPPANGTQTLEKSIVPSSQAQASRSPTLSRRSSATSIPSPQVSEPRKVIEENQKRSSKAAPMKITGRVINSAGHWPSRRLIQTKRNQSPSRNIAVEVTRKGAIEPMPKPESSSFQTATAPATRCSLAGPKKASAVNSRR